MQPQGPANPQGGPYNPYGPAPGPQPQPGQTPYAPGPQYPGGQVYPQQQPPTPAIPGQGTTPRPMMPANGQQPMPQYQPPQHLANQPANPEMPPAPQAPETPYDFFMQPKPAQPLNPLPVGGKHLGNIPTDYTKMSTSNGRINTAGLKGKFPLIAGGGIALIIILFAIMALAPKDQTGPQLLSLAQTQQEIVRVCSQGATKAKYRSTRFFAVTCSTGVTTNQKELLGYMSKRQVKYNAKTLGGKASVETDNKLKSAQSSSTYDATFREVVADQLDSYDQALTAQLGITTSSTARDVLNKSQSANQLLIKMVHDDSDKTEAPAATE